MLQAMPEEKRVRILIAKPREHTKNDVFENVIRQWIKRQAQAKESVSNSKSICPTVDSVKYVSRVKALSKKYWVFSLACFVRLVACLVLMQNAYAASQSHLDYNITTLAEGLKSPWAMAQVSEREWIVTERNGQLVSVQLNSHKQKLVRRIPLYIPELYVAGQGGLLDVVLSPDYELSGKLFLSFSKGSAENNKLAIASCTYKNGMISQFKIIFEVHDEKNTPVHFAGRLLFLPDETLLLSSGDGFDFREKSQLPQSMLGKILRIKQDGSVPDDNPFVSLSGVGKSPVYSIGHRNPQGLVYVKPSSTIFSHEHGPAGGDELNVIEAGENYGWPVVTQGNDYSGARISPFRHYPNMVEPILNWTPSIAPSGMAYYPHDEGFPFSSLYGHLLITTLVDKRMYAIDINSDKFEVYPVFSNVSGRLRDVKIAANGNVLILTDGEGAKLLMIEKPKAH